MNALFEETKTDMRSVEGKQESLDFIFHSSREEKPRTRWEQPPSLGALERKVSRIATLAIFR